MIKMLFDKIRLETPGDSTRSAETSGDIVNIILNSFAYRCIPFSNKVSILFGVQGIRLETTKIIELTAQDHLSPYARALRAIVA